MRPNTSWNPKGIGWRHAIISAESDVGLEDCSGVYGACNSNTELNTLPTEYALMSTLASTGVIRNQYELAYNCVALLHMFHRGNDRLAKRNSPHWRLWQPNKAHMNIPWPLNGDINLQYNANNVLREKISDKLLLGCWFVQIHERVWTCVIYGPWPPTLKLDTECLTASSKPNSNEKQSLRKRLLLWDATKSWNRSKSTFHPG